VAYTWAEFESYFDADIAAAIREAVEVDASIAAEPNSPRFDLPIDQGSILSSLSCHAPPLPLASLYYLIISKVFAYSIIFFNDLLHVCLIPVVIVILSFINIFSDRGTCTGRSCGNLRPRQASLPMDGVYVGGV
jgi:hypothetical protein